GEGRRNTLPVTTGTRSGGDLEAVVDVVEDEVRAVRPAPVVVLDDVFLAIHQHLGALEVAIRGVASNDALEVAGDCRTVGCVVGGATSGKAVYAEVVGGCHGVA